MSDITPTSKPFYVSNKELYDVYVEWLKQVKIATDAGKDAPVMPAFIAESIMKICTRLSYNAKFINYSFKEEMIGDAIYDCVKYVDKFKPTYIAKKGEFAGQEVKGNPFSYITTIAFNAFLRRIDNEKKQSYVKAKIIADTPIHEFFDSIDSDDIEMQQAFTEFIRENGENLTNNTPQAIKKKAKKMRELELLEVEDDEPSLIEFIEDENE